MDILVSRQTKVSLSLTPSIFVISFWTNRESSSVEWNRAIARISKRPVVVLRLRGRSDIGSTFLVLLERYRLRLAAADGRLMLAGVEPALHKQLERTGALTSIGQENIFMAQPELAASIGAAVSAAEDWLARPAEPA